MTKKRIAEIYQFLQTASMKRFNDEEKIMFIRLLRTLKPTATEMQDAVRDAMEKAEDENMKDVVSFVNKAVDDLAREDQIIVTNILTQEAFDRLVFSNDWNFAQIDELSEILIKTKE